MRTVAEIIQEIEDLGPEPHVKVENFVVVWDGPFGFAYQVQPEKSAELAEALRNIADSIDKVPRRLKLP